MSLKSKLARRHVHRPHQRPSSSVSVGQNGLDTGANGIHFNECVVAALSNNQISQMSCADLVQVIRTVRGVMLREEVERKLDGYDRETLERMVYLTRRYCANRQRLDANLAAFSEPSVELVYN